MNGGVFDAAIVGGGPAGCSAAITLAGLGARVVLFEAKTYPHDKLCGEFLSPECATMLDGLGVAPALRALGPVTIDTACLTAPDGAAWETRLPGVAWGLTRFALDAAMAERAHALGVAVRQATTVTGLGGSLPEGFTLETQSGPARGRVRARTIIAAHGKRGTLDRALGRRFLNRAQPFVALKAHFHGPLPGPPGRIELHAFRGGYCGMSEVEGGRANVCLLARESDFRRNALASKSSNRQSRPGLAPFLEWMTAQNPRLGDRLSHAKPIDVRWFSIGQVPFGDKEAVVGDVLMAGDAAGLIVPLAGDGIAIALHSGQLAATRCVELLDGRLPPREFRRLYAADWQREFGARIRLGRVLQAFMLRPRLLTHALRLIRAVPPFGHYLVTHTRDTRLGVA